MRHTTIASGQFIDLGTLRLERAVKRLQRNDEAGALADLRIALKHMQRTGADPLSVQHLSAIIQDAERASRQTDLGSCADPEMQKPDR